jgi:hypothetical protein
VEKRRYTNEIESVHSEIGDDLDHLVLCNELDLSNKQDFPINPKTNHTKSQTQRERETSSAEKSDWWGSDWPAISVGSNGSRVYAHPRSERAMM